MQKPKVLIHFWIVIMTCIILRFCSAGEDLSQSSLTQRKTKSLKSRWLGQFHLTPYHVLFNNGSPRKAVIYVLTIIIYIIVWKLKTSTDRQVFINQLRMLFNKFISTWTWRIFIEIKVYNCQSRFSYREYTVMTTSPPTWNQAFYLL